MYPLPISYLELLMIYRICLWVTTNIVPISLACVGLGLVTYVYVCN